MQAPCANGPIPEENQPNQRGLSTPRPGTEDRGRQGHQRGGQTGGPKTPTHPGRGAAAPTTRRDGTTATDQQDQATETTDDPEPERRDRTQATRTPQTRNRRQDRPRNAGDTQNATTNEQRNQTRQKPQRPQRPTPDNSTGTQPGTTPKKTGQWARAHQKGGVAAAPEAAGPWPAGMLHFAASPLSGFFSGWYNEATRRGSDEPLKTGVKAG